MKLIHITLSIIVLVFMCSCHGDHSISEDVSTAELAMATNDVEATREICDNLFGNEDKSAISATEWARLSILYMQLNERTDDPEVIEYAAQCYREAFRNNADSARIFYENLPVDDDKYVMTLSSIVHSLDNPTEIPADHDLDLDVAIDSI